MPTWRPISKIDENLRKEQINDASLRTCPVPSWMLHEQSTLAPEVGLGWGEGCQGKTSKTENFAWSRTQRLLGLVKVSLCLWASVVTLSWCNLCWCRYPKANVQWGVGGSTQPEKTQLRQTYEAARVANGSSHVAEPGWCSGRTFVTELKSDDPGKISKKHFLAQRPELSWSQQMIAALCVYESETGFLRCTRRSCKEECNRGVVRHVKGFRL